jgi:ATP-binding cassette subfamily C (CFTR/MRP) protein 1
VVLATSSGRSADVNSLTFIDANPIIVNYLSYANTFITLTNEGTVSHEASTEQLRSLDEIEEDSNNIEPTSNSTDSENEKTHSTTSSSAAEEKADIDESKQKLRQGGDLSVYRYYFSSMNWKVAAMFLIFQISLAFLSSFPCMFPYLRAFCLRTNVQQLYG